MSFSSVIFPVIIGYLFLTNHVKYKYDSINLNGYQLFLSSAVFGFVIYGLVYLLVYLLINLTTEQEVRFDDLIMFYITLSLFLYYMVFHNIRLSSVDAENYKRSALQRGDIIAALIVEANQENKTIEITLKNRKVYIGSPVFNLPSKNNETDIALIPASSGYRDEDELELYLTNHYFDFTGYSVRHPVNIVKSEVLSARIFEPEVYKRRMESRGE